MHINRESARMRVKSHGEGQSVDISSSAGVDFDPPDVKNLSFLRRPAAEYPFEYAFQTESFYGRKAGQR